MSSADPRVKLLWAVLCTSGAVLFAKPGWMLGLTLFTAGGALLFGADLAAAGRRLKKFLPVLLMIAAVQVVFVRTGEPLVVSRGTVLVSREGLWRGLAAALRLIVIFCTGAVMVQEDSRRVINALAQMGIPYVFCFSLFTALRFLPLFIEAFGQALTALQLRGVDLRRVPWRQKLHLYNALLIPVLTEALCRVEKMAAAMEARGFGALPRRTIYRPAAMIGLDWAAAFVLLTLGLISVRIYFTP
jgi:energy-coupling factor transport system permease protein